MKPRNPSKSNPVERLLTKETAIAKLRGKPGTDHVKNLEKQLDRAYDIRKFETELYWKKAAYFWGFLIASFTAYFIVSEPARSQDDTFSELLVICIGCIFSFSWYLVNRGNLYWQVNVERMIDTIEEELEMPYYKIYFHNIKKKTDPFEAFPFTISKINTGVSLFISVIWFFLGVLFFFKPQNKIHLSFTYQSFIHQIYLKELVIVLITLAGYYYLFFKTTFKPGEALNYSLDKRMNTLTDS